MKYKIVRDDSISAVIAFKDGVEEIKIIGEAFDAVPYDELEKAANDAREEYDRCIATDRAKGETPKSLKYKAQVIEKFLTPLFNKHNYTFKQKRGKRSKTKINPDMLRMFQTTDKVQASGRSNLPVTGALQIIPMKDLCNEQEIEEICKEADGPIFVTKDGYGSLVIMDIDYYNRLVSDSDIQAKSRRINSRLITPHN